MKRTRSHAGRTTQRQHPKGRTRYNPDADLEKALHTMMMADEWEDSMQSRDEFPDMNFSTVDGDN